MKNTGKIKKVQYILNKLFNTNLLKEQKEKLAQQQKKEEKTKGIQKTQLIGLENKNTLEDKVDLEKVRDNRVAIKRRYANRKNFLQKIFNLQDKDSSDAVSVKN